MFEHFFMHMLPKKVNENGVKLKPTFYLGALLVALFIFLSISGLLLLFYYTPERSQAFGSILFLEERVFLGGSFFRSFHRVSSHIFLLVLSAHLLRVIFCGGYKVRTYSWRLGGLSSFHLLSSRHMQGIFCLWISSAGGLRRLDLSL